MPGAASTTQNSRCRCWLPPPRQPLHPLAVTLAAVALVTRRHACCHRTFVVIGQLQLHDPRRKSEGRTVVDIRDFG